MLYSCLRISSSSASFNLRLVETCGALVILCDDTVDSKIGPGLEHLSNPSTTLVILSEHSVCYLSPGRLSWCVSVADSVTLQMTIDQFFQKKNG